MPFKEKTSTGRRVIIIGAGLSGLYAGKLLHEAGHQVTILEKEERIGGRVVTEEVEGFLVDRGFQILLPAYPEAKAAFDYVSLDLKRFRRGARIYHHNHWEELRDPLDSPWRAMLSAFSKVGTVRDKLALGALQLRAANGTLQGRKDRTTRDYLEEIGFSTKMMEHFFIPFFEGVFLEAGLTRPSTEFAFYFRMFAEDGGALPAHGMAELPKQLALDLEDHEIRLQSEVTAISTHEGNVSAKLSNGEELYADEIVLAVETPALSSILRGCGVEVPKQHDSKRGTVSLAITATVPLKLPPTLHLVPHSRTGIRNIAPLSSVAPQYARNGVRPAGSTESSGSHPPELFSVNFLHHNERDSHEDPDEVFAELGELFSVPKEVFHLVKRDEIPEALPAEIIDPEELQLPTNIRVAGDGVLQGSINGALVSARRAVADLL
ncbi:FAD-dependent oxidoreductase [bacterium]|nr:FAD-dependent oxidoreductase [bacterium]